MQRLVWDHKGWTQPDPISLELMEHLQHGPENLVLMAHRESTKTTTFITYSLCRYLENLDYKILYSSATPNLSGNASYEAFSLMRQMSLFQHLLPEGSERQSVNEGWDVRGCMPTKERSFQPTSINSTVTGGRASEIVLDDPENKKNSLTPPMRAKTRAFVTEYLSLKKSNKGSKFRVLMTPHVEDSLVDWFKDRGFTVIAYPVRFPTVVDMARFKGILAPSLQKRMSDDPGLQIGGGIDGSEGKPINPWRLGEAWCQSKLVEVRWNEWQRQYMLNTAPEAQAKPLKLSNLIVTNLDRHQGPEKIVWGKTEVWTDLVSVGIGEDVYYKPAISIGLAPYQMKVMQIDPAAGGEDEMAYTVGGVVGNKICILKNGGFLMRSQSPGDEEELRVVRALIAIAVYFEVDRIVVESNFSMFASVLAPILSEECEKAGLNIGIETKPAKINKELRIVETLAPVLYDHRLVVDYQVIKDDYEKRRELSGDADESEYMLAYQLTRIMKRSRCLAHDDRLDSLASLVAECEDFMRLGHDAAIQRRRSSAEALRIEQYNKWAKGTLLYKARHEPRGHKSILQ